MDDIERAIRELSSEGADLMREVCHREREARAGVPPEVLLAGVVERLERIFDEHPEDRETMIAIVGAILDAHDEAIATSRAGLAKSEWLAKIISRAQELDRLAGRPVSEHRTVAEAVDKLEAAGALDPLESRYFDTIRREHEQRGDGGDGRD
jgi:hypothetical protein